MEGFRGLGLGGFGEFQKVGCGRGWGVGGGLEGLGGLRGFGACGG